MQRLMRRNIPPHASSETAAVGAGAPGHGGVGEDRSRGSDVALCSCKRRGLEGHATIAIGLIQGSGVKEIGVVGFKQLWVTGKHPPRPVL